MKVQAVQHQIYEQDLNLLDYWHLLWKNKKIIICIVFLSMVFAGLYLKYAPKTYLSEASILIMDQAKSPLGGIALGIEGFSLSGGGGSVEKLIFIFNSKTLAERVVNKLNIVSFLEQQNKDAFSFSKFLHLSKNKNIKSDNQHLQYIKKRGAIGYLQKKTHISSKDGGVVTLNVEWRNPNTIADVVSTYIAEVSTFMNDNSININFKVIDPAQPPTDSYKPQAFKIWALSFLSSVVGSVLLVFVKEAIQSDFDKTGKGDA